MRDRKLTLAAVLLLSLAVFEATGAALGFDAVVTFWPPPAAGNAIVVACSVLGVLAWGLAARRELRAVMTDTHVTTVGYEPDDRLYVASCSCGEGRFLPTWDMTLAWRNRHDPGGARPDIGPYPHWHVPGWCHHSGTQFHHGQRPAEYWSMAPNGYWFAECAECCAATRRIGAENPDLAPLRVCTAA